MTNGLKLVESKNILIEKKEGTNFEEIFNIVRNDSIGNKDYTVNLKNLKVLDNGIYTPETGVIETSKKGIEDLSQQLSSLNDNITINSRFLSETYENHYDLFQNVVNKTIGKELPDKEVVLRIKQNNKRYLKSIVSTRYQIYDNYDLLNDLRFNQNISSTKIKNFRMNDNIMIMQYVLNPLTQIQKGDVFSMMTLRNSETRMSPLSLLAGMFQYWCSNGCYSSYGGEFGMTQKHLGDRFNEFIFNLTPNHDLFLENLKNYGKKYIDLQNKTIDHGKETLKENLEEEIKRVNRIFTEKLPKMPILNAELLGYEPVTDNPASRFEFQNRITKVSQSLPVDQRDSLDRIAFNYINN